MTEPTLKQINEERKKGLRPEAVACFLHGGKVLFLLKNDHRIWQFPQGNIENKEKPADAIVREITEELGKEFMDSCDKDLLFFGEDEAEFAPVKHGLKELKTDEGEEIVMKGKKYYFYALHSGSEKLDIKQTEFDDYVWLPYEPAKFLADRIPQPNKKRVTVKVVDALHDLSLL